MARCSRKFVSVVLSGGVAVGAALWCAACSSVPELVFDDATDGAATDGGAGSADGSGAVDGRAASDAGSCLAPCTGGCANNTCRITNPPKKVTCPSGMRCVVDCAGGCEEVDCNGATSCRVECPGGKKCDKAVIRCGAAPCSVVCTGGQACSGTKITPGTTQSLCVECANNGCSGLSCSASATGAARCGSGDCAPVTGCGALDAGAPCP